MDEPIEFIYEVFDANGFQRLGQTVNALGPMCTAECEAVGYEVMQALDKEGFGEQETTWVVVRRSKVKK